MFRVVLADTSVLFGRTVRDYLLYSQKQHLIDVYWSREILDELEHTLARQYEEQNPDSEAAAHRLRLVLERAFPDASVEVSDSDLHRFDGLTLPDPDDKHVLAAAYTAQADIICTDNLDDFPPEAADLAGVEVASADEAISRLMREYPDEMVEVHRQVVASNPRLNEPQTISKLESARCFQAADGVRAIIVPGGSHWVRAHNKSGRGHWSGHWRRNRSQ